MQRQKEELKMKNEWGLKKMQSQKEENKIFKKLGREENAKSEGETENEK